MVPSGGTGGTSGNAGTGSGAGTGGESTSGAGASGPVLSSLYCGDGVRDATAGSREECDDGPGTEPDLCTNRCQVSDALAVRGTAGGTTRYLGSGRHPVAAGRFGFGVTFVEPEARPVVVGLSVFDAVGDPRARISVSAGSNAMLQANPVAAELDDGSYALAWTDFGSDGDELGVALRRVRPAAGTGDVPPEAGFATTATLSPLQFANDVRSFSQYDADIIRTGERLIVAWTDTSNGFTGPDIRYREFDFAGAATRRFTATTDELPLSFDVGFEGNVALAALDGGSWAAAYRSMQGAVEETIEVVVPDEGTAWSIGPDLMGASDDRPAIAELDADHLLVVFTVGTDPGATSISNVFRLRAAIIDRDESEPLDTFDLPPLGAAYQSASVSQTHPNVVRAGDDLYVAYRASALGGQAEAEDVFLQKLTWDGEIAQASEYRIPRWPLGSSGDQRFPALAFGPRQIGTEGLPEPAPLGALVVAWDDYGREHGTSQGEPDVLVQHWPLPIVRLDELVPDDCSVAAPCGPGEGHCESNAECQSGLVCISGRGPQYGLPPGTSVCVPGHCSDGVQNSGETDVDCGGECGACHCGNGVVEAVFGETCDDGNETDTDACPDSCEAATCGDGFVRAGVEECDPGVAGGPACDPDCTLTPNCSPTDPFISLTQLFPGVRADGIAFSADQLTAYVSTGATNVEIYVATRANVASSFGSLSAVANVNTGYHERAPWLSPDGLSLYFSTESPSGVADIVRSTRASTSAAFGMPQALSINTSSIERDPFFAPWSSTLYFASERSGSQRDLFQSTFDGFTFSTPQALAVVNDASTDDENPVLTPDGLKLYFKARRGGIRHPSIGADGDGDIWSAARASTSSSFGTPVIDTLLNTSGVEFPVAISADGCSLFIASNRETGLGSQDNYRLYEAKRGPPPANVTMTVQVIGGASDGVGSPINCAAGSTCMITRPYGTILDGVAANRQALWTGGCEARGGPGLSTDSMWSFTVDPQCIVQFP